MIGVLRRRVMGVQQGGILPSGYTLLDELSVSSGYYKIETDIGKGQNRTFKVFMTVKYLDVDASKRQLMGYERDPWFGCDKGIWKGSRVVSMTPAQNSAVIANTWYDVVFEGTTGSGYTENRLVLFSLANYHQYQNYASIKGQVEVYVDNVMVGNFVPCKNPSNISGVYNLITNNFCPLVTY